MSAHDPKDTERLDPGVLLVAKLLGSLALWTITFLLARDIIARETASAGVRAAGVAIGVAGFLPWVWVAGRAIFGQDEFTRRIHYIALSCAFAATGIFLFAADLLRHAHFIGYISYTRIWGFMVIAWFVSLVIANRYYR